MNLRALFSAIGIRSLGKRFFVFLGLIAVVPVEFDPITVRIDGSGFIELSSRLNGAVTEEMAQMLLQSTDVGIVYTLTVYAVSGKKTEYRSFKGLHYASLTGTFTSLSGSDTPFSGTDGPQAVDWFSSCSFALKTEAGRPLTGAFTAILRAELTLPGASAAENPDYLWRGAEPFVSVSWRK